ncbi:MAG: hypothetical protein K2M08_05015 [Anaeroplasmataceae bacterium]|nr:hypothetical protein [Anaeroplasmataceae bacterium]
MWKKILYFGIAIVIGILVYIIGYSSNQMNHLEGIVKSAIEKEEYYKVPMVWGGCFDTKSIADNTSDKLDLMIYPATSQTDVTYGDEDNSTRYLEFEKAYYVYIFNAKFAVDTATDGKSSFNKTAIEFSSNDAGSSSYDYYFVVSETINSSVYVSEPKSKEDVLLNNAREVTNTNANWNFMRITFTETMINQMVKEMNGNIHKLSIKDCDGNVIYSVDANLDFSQGFYNDAKVEEIFTKYNTYLSSYLAAEGDSSKLKELNNTWSKEFDTWKAEFTEESSTTGYTIGYERNVVTPSKLVWQTVGMLALYAVVILLFYVLLFHFSAIRRLFSRENYKDYSRDSKIIVNGKAVSRNKGKPVKEIKTEDVVLPDTTADESLETVTAGEVIAPVVEEIQSTPVETNDEVESSVEEPKVEESNEDSTPKENQDLVVEPTQEGKTITDEEVKTEEKVEEVKPAPKKTTTKTSTKKPATTKAATTSSSKKTTTKKPSTSTKTTSSKSTTTKKTTTKKTNSKVEGE